MIHVNRAIVFGVTEDQERVWERRAYAKRRGYRIVAVLDDWDTVLRLVGERKASIIIFVNRDARRLPADDGGATRDLSSITSAGVGMRNGLWPAGPSAADLTRAIEGSGPIPTGLDPVSIRAARRIWRHFKDHGCG